MRSRLRAINGKAVNTWKRVWGEFPENQKRLVQGFNYPRQPKTIIKPWALQPEGKNGGENYGRSRSEVGEQRQERPRVMRTQKNG